MKKSCVAISAVVLAGSLYAPPQSWAHDPEGNPGQAQHGGLYVEYEQHYGIELVQEGAKLIFHMTMHLEPRDMSGSAFQVIVLSDGKAISLTATPAGNTVTAELKAPLAAGSKVVLSGKDGDGDPLQARFVIE